ncbi:response regulator transcription factor [Kiritimatiellota bacterium B12222]|nr:response regulator transcription factor [Kiritimatiellota bacterium B12222]
MTSAIHILLVEDDPAIRQGLVDTLESENYRVSQASDGEKGLEKYQEVTPDLVILDVMMPGRSGYDVCREIRRHNQRIPVLMLTAKSEEIDKVLGLELGADDYMTKPFGVRELLARVHALLRRSGDSRGESCRHDFTIGPFRILAKQQKGRDGKQEIDLSVREVELLAVFAARPREVLTRDELLNHAWGVAYYGTTRTLDQHIAQLRKKIEPNRKVPTFIQTVHGVGYRYCPLSDQD